ncbi:hypothetical protein Y1Q_0024685 [Alligator mississippiensis]|uniref:Uncharacterized protein n=1 Tax=Alligator mississippiensis TaxID=8496 RepID=A0A151PH30_ALLMI|nr:hypothetical protein Y1Q_0024685 [Alligator mississippiensis]
MWFGNWAPAVMSVNSPFFSLPAAFSFAVEISTCKYQHITGTVLRHACNREPGPICYFKREAAQRERALQARQDAATTSFHSN